MEGLRWESMPKSRRLTGTAITMQLTASSYKLISNMWGNLVPIIVAKSTVGVSRASCHQCTG